MLSSIHPFGERSRNNSFALTASAHVLGSSAGGAVLGALVGALAWASALIWSPDAIGRALLVGAVAAGALALEATGRSRMLPTRLHQVDENWIQLYRGWVYGGGFGFELGFGLSTIITTALVHVMVVTMVATGSFVRSIAIGLVFGAVRGATVLATRSVHDPDELRRFHRRLDRLRDRSAIAGTVTLGLTAALVFGGAAW